MEENCKKDKRIECSGAKGTIKWVGYVPPTDGLWYGIDWDEESRGKHDGSSNGVKYFHTRFPKSGSFVRPSKVSFGMNLEEGIKDKYQNDSSIEKEKVSQLQRSIKARFVEVVGMEKISKQQSELSSLKVAVLDGWNIYGAGDTQLSLLLPNLRHLDVSHSLIASWKIVSSIAKQLPQLTFLNVSGNRLILPENPSILNDSFNHITHLVVNQMISFSWEDLIISASMFKNLKKIQMACNNFYYMSQISEGIFKSIEEIDLGVNAFTDWSHICFLGNLSTLKTLNLNNCQLTVIEFPGVPIGTKTNLFENLSHLMIADNPLKYWKSIGELDKLLSLKDLIITDKDNISSSFNLEFAFARIRNLEVLNRTNVSPLERRDFQLFYLRRFSSEFYSNGGSENPKEEDLSLEFREQHPSYFVLVKELGAPTDERQHEAKKGGRLKDLKMEFKIEFPDQPEIKSFQRSFLPSTRLSKVKMMIKRQSKMSLGLSINLSYVYVKDREEVEIQMDNDMKDLQFYSISSGDKLIVRL